MKTEVGVRGFLFFLLFPPFFFFPHFFLFSPIFILFPPFFSFSPFFSSFLPAQVTSVVLFNIGPVTPCTEYCLFDSVCVECLIGKQKKPILFKVRKPRWNPMKNSGITHKGRRGPPGPSENSYRPKRYQNCNPRGHIQSL